MGKSFVDQGIDFVGDAYANVGKSLNKLRRGIMKVTPVGWVASKIEDKVLPDQDKLIDKAKNKVTGKIKEAIGSKKLSYSTELTKNEVDEMQEEMETLRSIDKDLDSLKLYGFGKKGKRLQKSDVIGVVRSLPNLKYRKEFSGYLKNNNITGLQHSLNGKISDWEGNEEIMNKYREYLKGQGIWVGNSNHILEDGKLGPQTTATLKFVAENRSLLDPWKKKGRDFIDFISGKGAKQQEKNQDKADAKKNEKKNEKKNGKKRRRRG